MRILKLFQDRLVDDPRSPSYQYVPIHAPSNSPRGSGDRRVFVQWKLETDEEPTRIEYIGHTRAPILSHIGRQCTKELKSDCQKRSFGRLVQRSQLTV